MASNLFNAGPTWDATLANTKTILANQQTILTKLAQIQSAQQAQANQLTDLASAVAEIHPTDTKPILDAIAALEVQLGKIYSALFGIPVTVGLDLDNPETAPQPKPTKSGP